MVRLTLGAISSKGRISTGEVEVFYWIPCATWTPWHDERGKPIPHVWFISSDRTPTIFCPACRALPVGSRRAAWAEEEKTTVVVTEDLPF